ncbi:unnamed protein product [Malus baccata var. baccata]
MVMAKNKRSSVVKAGNARPKKNLWKPEEDLILKQYVETHGEGNWATVSKLSGLKRGGKSCRLRWKNYLRPNIKRGDMSQDEKDLIIRMHKLLGNRWSLIAGRLPGRTDNEVKNYWNTHLNKNTSCCPAGGKRKGTSMTDYSNHDTNITKKKNKINTSKTSSTATTTADNPMIISSTLRSPKDTNSDHHHQHHEEPNDGPIFATTSTTEESCFYYDVDIESPRELHYYMPSCSSNFNPAFVFDDEPFIGYMDPFLLFD